MRSPSWRLNPDVFSFSAASIPERQRSRGRSRAPDSKPVTVSPLIDADLGQPTIGPPGTVGLKIVREAADLEAEAPSDALAFVGAVSARGYFLPHRHRDGQARNAGDRDGGPADHRGYLRDDRRRLGADAQAREGRAVPAPARRGPGSRRRARADRRGARAVPGGRGHHAARPPEHRDALGGRTGVISREATGRVPGAARSTAGA